VDFPYFLLIALLLIIYYINKRGIEMAVKVKPVQPTEIKDKKIAREVIEQIRKPIPASVYKQHKRDAEFFARLFRK